MRSTRSRTARRCWTCPRRRGCRRWWGGGMRLGRRKEIEPQRHRDTEKTRTGGRRGRGRARNGKQEAPPPLLSSPLFFSLYLSSLCLCVSVVQIFFFCLHLHLRRTPTRTPRIDVSDSGSTRIGFMAPLLGCSSI